ncbi:MAG: hypothetical protein P1U49_07930 [Minwuia sp.]|nr:hypothetical protein [Minwuia sp.]
MARRSRIRQRQSGYAIAAVSFIGMIAMAGAASMLSTAPVAEVAEIEENLLQVRGHWASVGMFSYAISRGRQDGACAADCVLGDATRVDSYQAYVEEIYNARNKNLTTNNPTAMRWTYDEVNADYHVQLISTVSDLDLAVLDGKLLFQTELDDFGGFFDAKRAGITSAQTRAEFCTGLAAAGDACLTTVANPNNSGIARVQDFRILRP